MRVLILDDAAIRHEIISERHTADEVAHAYTHELAITLLGESCRFDVVYLDHNLESKHSGYDTAKFIAERLSDRLRPGVVKVHTCNPSEGDRMVRVLKDHGVLAQYEPFRV
jgi:CheY-like chemotaxis protein